MKNAHERFGKLVYVRRTEKTATNIRLYLDAFVGEERGKAHLASVIGGDVEIGAIAAAFAKGGYVHGDRSHRRRKYRRARSKAAALPWLDRACGTEAAAAASGRLLTSVGRHQF